MPRVYIDSLPPHATVRRAKELIRLMDRHSVNWHGYIPAVTTPFDADGALDLRGWQELLEWMVAEQMHGVAVAGTTGEWFSLSASERKQLFTAATAQIRGRIPVLAGCTAYTANEAIEYAQAAKECGMDGILLTPPPYVVPNEDEIVAFYKAVSDTVSIPICVYNWPRGTNVDLTKQTIARLAELECVVALKNSTPNVAHFIGLFFEFRDHLRYFGFPMNELGLSLVRHEGGDGTIGAGGVLGSDHPNFFNHAWAGRLDEARRCGARDRLLFDHWIAPDYSARFGSPQAIMKAALNLRGLPGGYPRPPLLPLTDEQLERVRQTLVELQLIDPVS